MVPCRRCRVSWRWSLRTAPASAARARGTHPAARAACLLGPTCCPPVETGCSRRSSPVGSVPWQFWHVYFKTFHVPVFRDLWWIYIISRKIKKYKHVLFVWRPNTHCAKLSLVFFAHRSTLVLVKIHDALCVNTETLYYHIVFSHHRRTRQHGA